MNWFKKVIFQVFKSKMIGILYIFFILCIGLEGFFCILVYKDLMLFVFFIVLEGVIINRVDNNEEYQEDNVYFSYFFL